ncbi:Uncharacterised protein [uncultured archaeon]|nr:Uncharacterised protein [uncultured archaeon]
MTKQPKRQKLIFICASGIGRSQMMHDAFDKFTSMAGIGKRFETVNMEVMKVVKPGALEGKELIIMPDRMVRNFFELAQGIPPVKVISAPFMILPHEYEKMPENSNAKIEFKKRLRKWGRRILWEINDHPKSQVPRFYSAHAKRREHGERPRTTEKPAAANPAIFWQRKMPR